MPLEVFPSQYRKLVGFSGMAVWSVATMTIPLLAYLLKNCSWRVLQIVYALVALYALILYWIIDESIPWLVANGKTKQVVRILKRAAKISGVNLHDVMKPLNLQQVEEEDNEEVKLNQGDKEDQPNERDTFFLKTSLPDVTEMRVNDADGGSHYDLHHEIAPVKRYTIFDMLKNKRLLLYTCIFLFTWLTNALTYFGLFLTSSSLAGNHYLNFFLNAAVELPASGLFYIIIDRLGRKMTCRIFHGVAGVALITSTILRTSDSDIANGFSTVFSLIGKFGISGSFGMLFLYTPEIFPTNLRNVGLGMCSAFARIGGMLSPFSNLLAAYAFWAPGTIFGVCCLVVTVLVMFLPESTGRELPQTIEDLTAWHTRSVSVTYIPADDVNIKDIPHNDDNMKNVIVLHCDVSNKDDNVSMKDIAHDDVSTNHITT